MTKWVSPPLEHRKIYLLKEMRPKKLLKFFRVLESLSKTLWLAYYTMWVELLGTLNWVLSL
jgi:hypothetical protein